LGAKVLPNADTTCPTFRQIGLVSPGRLRTLEGVIEACPPMAQGDMIDVRDLPQPFREQAPPVGGDEENPMTMAEVERHHACRVREWMAERGPEASA